MVECEAVYHRAFALSKQQRSRTLLPLIYNLRVRYTTPMTNHPCIFCDKDNPDLHEIIAENEFAYSAWDANPVSEGHVYVTPSKHIVSIFDIDKDTWQAMHEVSQKVRDLISEKFDIDQFTIGFNEGRLAGRTIDHVHMHIIPRYAGDVKNPRGGIRHIIPGKGYY